MRANSSPTSDTARRTNVTIDRAAAAVASGDGREFATDFVLTAVRQYEYNFQYAHTRAIDW
ncbi:hypothetical protein E2L06_11945 [Haloterrigena sp. H1]|nr:hypothetical protein E2L06_11945 [Haloterrigena sp. H1]